MQAEIKHPLEAFGYRRPPFWLWRIHPQLYVFVAAVKDVWLIVTGRLSLHKAWQAGHNHGSLMEISRQVRGVGMDWQISDAAKRDIEEIERNSRDAMLNANKAVFD